MRRRLAFALLALAAPAAAAPLFLSILPPGQDGLVPESGAPGPHVGDQVAPYRDLVVAAPLRREADLLRYFHDASIAPPPTPERVETPRAGVTISRDAAGVPHVVGATRGDVFFGAGYASAEDRLFLMDVFRHVGRGRLSEFLGAILGLDATLAMDRAMYATAGYSEAELQAQVDAFPTTYPQFPEIVNDLNEFTAGVNAYIAEARMDATKMPREYSAFGVTLEDWLARDVVPITVLFAATFGNGGGGEHLNAVLRQALEARYGAATGDDLWADLREANDPEAPVTTTMSFPYLTGGPVDAAAVAIPDAGSIDAKDPIAVLADVRRTFAFPPAMSNFLGIAPRRAKGRHPIGVMGPQTGYRGPEVLIELALEGGGIAVRGATFPGLPYVALGHTPHYAWSATSGESDLSDVRVERLCDPEGGPAGGGTLFQGTCRPLVTRVDTWMAGGTTVTATVERTPHGNVFARATVNGAPVALVAERSNFMREIESAPWLALLDADAARTPEDFRATGAYLNQTFNLLYVNGTDLAYYHSGRFPIRAAGVDPDLPSWGTGEWEWQGVLANERHPFEVNPKRGFFDSWNNKPAPDWRAADANYAWGPVHRALMLETRLARLVRHRAEPVHVVNAMADAATVDLRGATVLPEALPLARAARSVRRAVALLRRWVAKGAHRVDRDGDGRYDDDAAVALMDAWYPKLVHAVFDPQLGGLYDQIPLAFDDAPGSHVGSAYQAGWYGYLVRTLRAARRKKGIHYRVLHCADGTKRGCATAVASSLAAAVAELNAAFGSMSRWHADPKQDEIQFALGGLAAQPAIPWQNRPTFQQVVQIR
ncbi:MAG TPA: penicillin acylase family protein [Candidatus Binatia bacterium]|nr:penicillin acylase family protein [Candidatus Binatia bacterium]